METFMVHLKMNESEGIDSLACLVEDERKY